MKRPLQELERGLYLLAALHDPAFGGNLCATNDLVARATTHGCTPDRDDPDRRRQVAEQAERVSNAIRVEKQPLIDALAAVAKDPQRFVADCAAFGVETPAQRDFGRAVGKAVGDVERAMSAAVCRRILGIGPFDPIPADVSRHRPRRYDRADDGDGWVC